MDAVYEGKVIYTPSSFLNLIPDRYKMKPISLYDPRDAPLLNQYRLIVPRTRNILEISQFCILLALYISFMAERDPSQLSSLEVCFTVYAFGWVLDLLATILEHGWYVYYRPPSIQAFFFLHRLRLPGAGLYKYETSY